MKTVAGSGPLNSLGIAVNGGYRDGAISEAQFRNPRGVAVAKDGAIYVADTGNHCVRRIAAGRVETYAGSPTSIGGNDGARREAQFVFPTALAMADNGDLYVLDAQIGIRVVHAGGTVETRKGLGDATTTAIATTTNGSTPFLIVGGAFGFRIFDLVANTMTFSIPLGDRAERPFEGKSIAPVPTSIAAFNNREFVFTDTLHSSVRYASIAPNGGVELRTVSAIPDQRSAAAPIRASNGATTERFDQPTGIAVDRTGQVFVSDSADRKIFRYDAVDRDTPELVDRSVHRRSGNDRAKHHLLLVGDSQIWTNVTWSQSIPGQLTSVLETASPSERTAVFPVRSPGGTTLSLLDYVTEFADEYDEVVLLVNPHLDLYDHLDRDEPKSNGGVRDYYAGWEGELTTALGRVRDQLEKNHTPFVVVLYPDSFSLPQEQLFESSANGSTPSSPNEVLPIDPAEAEALRVKLRGAVTKAGVTVLDLWPAMTQAERTGDRSLYASWDHHFSPFTCALVARAIGAELARVRRR